LIPYFIWSQVTFGTPFAFREGYSNAVGSAVPFGWYNLGFFYSLTGGVLFVLFLIGLFIALRFILYLDIIAKDRRAAFNPEIFSIISLVIVSAFYIFYIRGTEDRWVFLWLPFIFFFVSNSIDKISELVEGYAKGLGIIILVGLLLIVVYSQYTHGNELILNKKDSYAPIKQAALWMKDNSNKTDLIVSASITQTTYYSERNVSTFSSAAKTPEEYNQFIYQNEPRFIEVSAFEGQPEWLNSWIDVNQKSLNPVKVYYADPARTQPIVIIYQIMYSN
jgi:hypothetical protein